MKRNGEDISLIKLGEGKGTSIEANTPRRIYAIMSI